MGKFWLLEPEVAGEIEETSIIDTSVHPPMVKRLSFLMTGWLGDDLVESFPCYLITTRAHNALQEAKCTGYSLDSVDLILSPEFRDLYPDRIVPSFLWLKIVGTTDVDDFSLSEGHLLSVSDKALQILNRFNLNACDIYPVH